MFILKRLIDNKSSLDQVFNGLFNRPYCLLQVQDGHPSTPTDNDQTT